MKSIFKLNKLHLFLIVIFVLLASSLGFSMIEYFQSEIQSENEALKEGVVMTHLTMVIMILS